MANPEAAATAPGQEAPSGEETLLQEHLRRIGDNRNGVFAVHVHLSELKQRNRKPHYMRVAARSFENLEHSYDAALFRLANFDMVLVCRDVPIDEVDEVLFKVRGLFAEDPLTAAREGSFEDHFSTWYDLSQEEDFATFKEAVADLVAEAERRKKEAEEQARRSAEAAKAMAGEPLTPKNLAEINNALQGTRISDLVRQQPAVLVGDGKFGDILFREYFISMADLQKRIAPQVNLFSSTWLFHYLTETLDKRMLILVGRRDFAQAPDPISLNLNIATVLSQEFQHFHRNIGANADKVVVEVQTTDVLADIGTYYYARDTLQDHGYRVLVDGFSPLTLQYLDPRHLQADYIKITWGPEFAGDYPKSRMAEMREMIQSAGRKRVVLGRVDSEEAVAWGLSLGIHRFQGYFVDRLVQRMIDKGLIK